MVGAYAVFGEEPGYIAGCVARDILEGKSLDASPAQGDQQGMFVFNAKPLERFGLTLPEFIGEKAVFR